MIKLKPKKSFISEGAKCVLEHAPGPSRRKIPLDYQTIRSSIVAVKCSEIMTPSINGGREKKYMVYMNANIKDRANPQAPDSVFILVMTSSNYIDPNLVDIRDMFIYSVQEDPESRNAPQKFYDAAFGLDAIENVPEPTGSWAAEQFDLSDLDLDDEIAEGESDEG